MSKQQARDLLVLTVNRPAAHPADSAEALLRDLVECVNALENRAIRSSGEFHVWAEQRMVTESRDRAAAFLQATEPSPAAEPDPTPEDWRQEALAGWRAAAEGPTGPEPPPDEG